MLRLLRLLLTLASAFGVTYGANLNNNANLAIIASSLVGIGTIVWTIVEWVQNARHTHAVAVASASARRAVQPAATTVK